jgi:hypothetical protein
MTTPSKRWPNNAEWARMDAISAARESWKTLDQLLDELSNPNHIRKVARVMEKQREIENKLIKAKDAAG